MARLPVQIPPGVKRAGTAYLSQGRWYEANLMRWFEGSMRPVGGWEAVDSDPAESLGATSVQGTPRGLLIWRANDGTVYLAIGTTSNIYVYSAGLLTDITAVGTTVVPPPDGTNVYGDPTVYGSPDTYGGTPPEEPAAPSGPLIADDESLWSLDTFGQFLVGVFAPADGKLRMWELTGTMEEVAPGGESVDGAPIDNRAVVVTPERFVFLLGAGGDARRIVWPDQERISGVRADDGTSVWSPGGTAGEFTLTTSGRLLAGLRTPRETLLWTDVDLWSAIYVGSDILYSFEKRGTSCGLIGPNAWAGVGDGAIWMSDAGFYSYFGNTVPVPCEVHEHVFSELERQHKKNIVCFHNSQFGEVWWFYPALGAENPNRYVAYNYREKHWMLGQLERTACTDRGGYEYPVMASEDGVIYEHEKGHDRNGLLAFASTGPLEIPPGNNVFMIREIVPDNHPNTVLVASLITSLDPLDPEVAYGPYSLAYNTPVRHTARAVRVMLHETRSGEDWRLGQFRLEIEPAGER